MQTILPRVRLVLGLAALCVLCLSPAAGAAENQAVAPLKNRVPGASVTASAWPGGTMLAPGKWAISDHVGFAHGELRKGGGSHTNRNARGEAVGQDDNDRLTNTFKIRYGLADGWDVRLSVPFVNNDIHRHSPQDDTWKGGFNDMTLMLRRRVVGLAPGQPFAVAVDVGAVIPAGEVGANNVGTGAWALVFGGGASWIDCNQRVDVDARYVTYTQRGAHRTTPADYFQSHAHYAYALTDWFDAGLETNVRVSSESEVGNAGQDDEYTEWYGGPKVQFHVRDWGLSFGTAALLPIYRHYESPKGRLSDDVRYEFRVGMVF